MCLIILSILKYILLIPLLIVCVCVCFCVCMNGVDKRNSVYFELERNYYYKRRLYIMCLHLFTCPSSLPAGRQLCSSAGGLGMAVVWGAVKKRNDARIIFYQLRMKKEKGRSRCAQRIIISIISRSIQTSARKERTNITPLKLK